MNPEIKDTEHCDLSVLPNYFLVSFPGFFILGKPVKTSSGIKFEKQKYIKIRATDIEDWFNELNNCIQFCDSELPATVEINIKEESNCTYFWKGIEVVGEKKIIIGLKTPENKSEPEFQFSKTEVKLLLHAVADLIPSVFCFNTTIYKLFQLISANFLTFGETHVHIIANFILKDFKRLLEKLCEKHNLNIELDQCSEILYRHKIYFLIIFLIKTRNRIPPSSLIASLQIQKQKPQQE